MYSEMSDVTSAVLMRVKHEGVVVCVQVLEVCVLSLGFLHANVDRRLNLNIQNNSFVFKRIKTADVTSDISLNMYRYVSYLLLPCSVKVKLAVVHGDRHFANCDRRIRASFAANMQVQPTSTWRDTEIHSHHIFIAL